MLQNGLGKILLRNCRGVSQFVDLFAGSGAVACFVAEKKELPVRAFDLQSYSANLAGAIISRTKPIDHEICWEAWEARASRYLNRHLKSKLLRAAELQADYQKHLFRRHVEKARRFCRATPKAPVTRAYGGHYFSPLQSLWIDALRASAPKKRSEHDTCLSALIQAASRSAASPGHTAQPFQPTITGRKWIRAAWIKDIKLETKQALTLISRTHAKVAGKAAVSDASNVAKRIAPNSLVFVDPPYSAVHYSRFYHVLETISTGKSLRVTGRGRYPSPSDRPRSGFSIKGEAPKAVGDLLKTLSERRARVILTFPWTLASNGISGRTIERLAKKHFITQRKRVRSRFSTLGGYGDHRSARIATSELILTMRPKPIPRR